MKKYYQTLVVFFLFLPSLYGKERIDTTTFYFMVGSDRIISGSMKNIGPKEIKTIYIEGSASPEGTEEENYSLAESRAKKVLSFFPDSISREVKILGENWEGLEDLISRSEERYKDKALPLIRERNKKALIRFGIWKSLRSHYFPLLRYSKVVVEYLPPSPIIEVKEKERVDTLVLHARDTVQVFRDKPIIFLKSSLFLPLFPNIQAEIYTWVWGLSLEFSYSFPWWSIDSSHFYYQLLNGTVGIRKYLHTDYSSGWWFGIYGNTGYYDFEFGNKGWQGEHWGFGLGCGYILLRKGRLRLEPYLRVGYLRSRFDTYTPGDPYKGRYYYMWTGEAKDFKPRNLVLDYFGPTEIGFNIAFDITP